MGKQTRYDVFISLLTLAVATVCTYYLPTVGLSAAIYVGYKAMINIGSLLVYFSCAIGVLLGWFGVFLYKFYSAKPKKSDDSGYALYLHTLIPTSEFRIVFWIWLITSAIAVVVQLTVYIVVTIRLGFFQVAQVATATESIGSTGTLGNTDDLFQMSAIVTFVAGTISLVHFVHLNSLVYFYGSNSP